MPTTPDRLETAAAKYREWTEILHVAVIDATQALDVASGDESRAMVAIKDDLVKVAALRGGADQLLDLLALCLVRLAAENRTPRRVVP
jgi:hypothetical protein